MQFGRVTAVSQQRQGIAQEGSDVQPVRSWCELVFAGCYSVAYCGAAAVSPRQLTGPAAQGR
jgi:hypothetical protein